MILTSMKYLVLTVGALLTSFACQNEPTQNAAGSNPNGATPSTEASATDKSKVAANLVGAKPTATLTQTAPSVKKQALSAGKSANRPGKSVPSNTPTGQTAPAAAATTPAAAPSTAPVGELRGPVVTEDAFSIWLQADGPAVAGKPASVKAVLIAHPPYHCNEEYPHKFKYSAAPEGLSYPKKDARGMKTTAKKGVLNIPVQAKAAGTATVSGKLLFSVCTEERCLVEKQDLSLALVVQ